MSITLYSMPRCVQCDATKRAFMKQGIAFDEVDVTADPAAADHLKSLGYSQAPVVFAGSESWSGFRPDKIKQLAAQADAISV